MPWLFVTFQTSLAILSMSSFYHSARDSELLKPDIPEPGKVITAMIIAHELKTRISKYFYNVAQTLCTVTVLTNPADSASNCHNFAHPPPL